MACEKSKAISVGKIVDHLSLSLAPANQRSLQALGAGEMTDLCLCCFQSGAVQETKAVVSELCRNFYTLGWVLGTGGSITVKVHEDNVPKSDQLIVMSPSGVQKERMAPGDMYVLSSDGLILSAPAPKAYPHKPPKCSDCADLFLKIFEMCNAGAVIHSHGIESCIVTMIDPFSKEFRIAGMEMIKGIDGHGFLDELVVPIIENASSEGALVEPLTKAIRAYPETKAILVRNHGVFVWGDSWISTKTQAECYHYLFSAALELHRLGLHRAHGSLSKMSWLPTLHHDSKLLNLHILLDLEGTATPLSANVFTSYSTFDKQNSAASHNKMKISAPNDMLPQGQKCEKPLKPRDFVGTVYDDVPDALQKWHFTGVKVYVCSSNSRERQYLVFGKSNYGDLRKYLCGYFDITERSRTKRQSYNEILQAIGAAKPSNVLFVTATLEEALAAREAGLEVIILVRPGGKSLPENHGVRTVESLLEIH